MTPLSSISVADLERHHVWRYSTRPASDQDESYNIVVVNGERLSEWVEPVAMFEVPSNSSETFIASSQFHLADGRELTGYCSPADDSGLDYIQPVIVTPQGHVRLWWDWQPPTEVLDLALRLLGASRGGVFPIRYRCLVPCDGKYLEGSVERLNMSERAT